MTSNALIGIAGVHFIAAELSRRRLIALPTASSAEAVVHEFYTPCKNRL
jgi:hypothetical protein